MPAFYATTVQRRLKNIISKVRNGEGQWLEREDEVGFCFKFFFMELFTSSRDKDFSHALTFVKSCVSEDVNNDLMRPLSMLEVKDVAFQLGKDKAPRPEGFSVTFFQFS